MVQCNCVAASCGVQRMFLCIRTSNERKGLVFMEAIAIRQVIDSSLLDGVVSLPKKFQNRKVQIIVFLEEETKALPSLTERDLEAMLEGSVTESLIGALPRSKTTLEDYRAERLAKYERVD